MDMLMVPRVLWLRRALRHREHWSEQALREHQRREAAALRAFASAKSPFYRQFHDGLDGAPLGERGRDVAEIAKMTFTSAGRYGR